MWVNRFVELQEKVGAKVEQTILCGDDGFYIRIDSASWNFFL